MTRGGIYVQWGGLTTRGGIYVQWGGLTTRGGIYVQWGGLTTRGGIYVKRSALSGDNNRCIPPGVGSHCRHHNIGGPWTPTEKNLHINCLELLGASHAVKALCKGGTNMIVAAVAYINHLGGTRSSALCSIVTDLWEWCLDRRIFMLESYVPGVQNTLADRLSRSAVDRHDWMLNRSIFRKLNTLWGPLVVDLFATRATAQLPRFYSWKPDPQAEAVDAFTQDWLSFKGYATPPCSLVGG